MAKEHEFKKWTNLENVECWVGAKKFGENLAISTAVSGGVYVPVRFSKDCEKITEEGRYKLIIERGFFTSSTTGKIIIMVMAYHIATSDK